MDILPDSPNYKLYFPNLDGTNGITTNFNFEMTLRIVSSYKLDIVREA